MSSALVRDLPTTGPERQTETIASLERRIAVLERARVTGIQRIGAESEAEFTSSSTSWTLPPGPEIELYIPSRDSLLLVDWKLEARRSGPSGINTRMMFSVEVNQGDPGAGHFQWDLFFTHSPIWSTHQPLSQAYSAAQNGALFPARPSISVASGWDLEEAGNTIPGPVQLRFIQAVLDTSNVGHTRNRRLTGIVV